MADVLAAAAVLLAVLAGLFGLWSPDMAKALDLPLSGPVANLGSQQRQIRGVVLGKAIPLLLAAWTTVAIFLPRSIGFVAVAAGCLTMADCHYDDVSAAFVATELFTLLIAGVASFQTCRLWKKDRKAHGK